MLFSFGSGTVVCRWQPLIQDAKCNIEYAVYANYINVNNASQSYCAINDEMVIWLPWKLRIFFLVLLNFTNAPLLFCFQKEDFKKFWQQHKNKPFVGRNEILMNFCPQIYGLYQVKLAVALVLAGGVSKMSDSGTKIRGDCHLLLIGDPGVCHLSR